MSGDDWSRSVRGGVVWSVLAYASSRAFTLVATVILARLLVPAQFGLVAAVTVFLSLIELASDLGMSATVVYEQESGRSRRVDIAFTINLVFAVTLVGAGLLLAPLIADLFGAGSHVGLFRLGALSLLFTGLGNIHDSLLLRELEFNRRIVPQVVRSAVRGAVSIVLVAATSLGAEALVIGMLAGSASWAAAQWLITGYRPRLAFERSVFRSMAAYGGAATVLEVLGAVGTRIDQIVIARVLGPAALGLYSIAFRIPETAIDSVSWTVSIVAFPALARKRATDSGGLGAATLSLLRFQALYALPAAAGLAMLSTPLVVVLFGARWHEAGPVMSAVCVLAGITAVVFPLGDVFKALGRQRTLILISVLQFPVFVATIVLVAPYGILAVGWARVGTYSAQALVTILLIMRVVSIHPRQAAGALRPAAAAAVGVAIGGGALRLLWPADSIGSLLAGSVAAVAAGALTLRLLAPGTLTELREMLPSLGRGDPAPAVGR